MFFCKIFLYFFKLKIYYIQIKAKNIKTISAFIDFNKFNNYKDLKIIMKYNI